MQRRLNENTALSVGVRLVLWLSLSLAVSSCYVQLSKGLPPTYDVSADSGDGVIVGTVGARPAPGKPPWYEWSKYEFQSVSDPTFQEHITSAFKWNPFYMWGTMPLCADDGLEFECGHVFALRLPAGEYEFQDVAPAMMSAATDHGFSQRGWSTPLTGFRFVVQPGQVTYIGNILSRICVGTASSWSRGNVVLSAIGDVADMSNRDIPLIVMKYPQLKAYKIINNTMTGKPWVWRFRGAEGKKPPYGWPPDCSPTPDKIQTYLRNED